MTRQNLVDNGHEDVVVFENPDFDGCIIGVTTDNQAVYSLAQMVDWYVKKIMVVQQVRLWNSLNITL